MRMSADLATLIDRVLPGPRSSLEHVARTTQASVATLLKKPAIRPVTRVLHGNEWLGHPMHPVIITVPIGAWCVSGWYDARSARTQDPRDEHAADGALRVGIVGALLAVATGLPQYLDTRDGVRREALVHAGMNNAALGLYLASWALRKRGRRPLARKLSAVGLGLVGVSGYLGGDISYRHGVGVRPQALRSPHLSASATSSRPLEASMSRHS